MGPQKYDVELLKLDLACVVRSFCVYLFPNGRYRNGEYSVGSLNGEPGKSLKICTYGGKTGVWKDFATGESGDNLLDLLCKARGGDFRRACEEATNWLADPERYSLAPVTLARMNSGQTSKYQRHKPEHCKFDDLLRGTMREHGMLAQALDISLGGVLLADGDGVLKYFNSPVNGWCWSVTDRDGHVRQDRRIDGQPFILKDKRAVKARTIGSPLWPIGVPTDKPVLTITEGSSDFLAAYSLICAEGVEKYVAPVAILGAANIIHDEALEYFRGKYVLMFPDYDRAGISAATRWSKQLKPIAAEIKSFSFDGLVRDDGQKIKDLRDFLRVDVDQWEGDADVRSPLANFVSNLVSKGSINEPKEIK